MRLTQQAEITKIAQEFAGGFEKTIGGISGSGTRIVDPLMSYLDFLGHAHTPAQVPGQEGHPPVLVLVFADGTQFVPAGGDLRFLHPACSDWMWI